VKAIICGGRKFVPAKDDWFWLRDTCEELGVIEVVSGCAPGADKVGERYADLVGLPIKRFPADWKRYRNAAGPIRNQQMAEYADACIALPGGIGTQDMLSKAVRHGLMVRVRGR